MKVMTSRLSEGSKEIEIKKKNNKLRRKKRKSKADSNQKLKLIRRKKLLRRRRLARRRRLQHADSHPAPVELPQSYTGINENLVVCSVTSASNLYKAKAMARSVKQHEPMAKVLICVVEEYLHSSAQSEHVDEWILAKDLNVPSFYHNMFKYNASEGTTSTKAATLKYAMQRYADEKLFLYLDTDMRVYHPLTELKEQMNLHPIILTPHVLSLSRHNDDYLYHGIFNSGLLALTRTEAAEQFLNWWDEKLYQSCYYDDLHFADQGWLDFAPLYFNAEILRHPGYNIAAWNIGESGRTITHEDNGYYYLDDKPLCIFHFSGVWGFLEPNIQHHVPDRSNSVYHLLDSYKAELNEMGRMEISNIPWSYDLFSDGEAITKDTRSKYKENPDAFRSISNPYKASNDDFV